jgi:hypothetical protein
VVDVGCPVPVAGDLGLADALGASPDERLGALERDDGLEVLLRPFALER